jgi:hypothetical protein
VGCAVLAEEAPTMEVDDDIFAFLDSFFGVVNLQRFEVDF